MGYGSVAYSSFPRFVHLCLSFFSVQSSMVWQSSWSVLIKLPWNSNPTPLPKFKSSSWSVHPLCKSARTSLRKAAVCSDFYHCINTTANKNKNWWIHISIFRSATWQWAFKPSVSAIHRPRVHLSVGDYVTQKEEMLTEYRWMDL